MHRLNGHTNPTNYESDKKYLEGKVQIMTLHKSKGDEFDYVFIPEFTEKNLPLTPEALITLIKRGEEISYTKNSGWLLPYEYVCWKNIMADIEPDKTDLVKVLSETYKEKEISNKDFQEIIDADFCAHWFLDSHYSSEFEAFLEITDSEVLSKDFDFDTLINKYISSIFYPEEYEIRRERLLVCSYMEHIADNTKLADKLYRLYFDKNKFEELLKNILRRSIYEYYFTLKYNTEENQNKFTLKQLDDIITSIESKWVKNV